MKKLLFLTDDIRLSFHWCQIGRLRRKSVMLLEGGMGCFHPELVKCSNKILEHGMVVSRIWNRQKKRMPSFIDVDLDTDSNELSDVHTVTA